LAIEATAGYAWAVTRNVPRGPTSSTGEIAWVNRRLVLVDLALAFEPVRQAHGGVVHTVRLSAGPAWHARWGETPTAFYTDLDSPAEEAALVESLANPRLKPVDHVYRLGPETPTDDDPVSYVLANDDRDTSLGAMIGVAYGVALGRTTLRLAGTLRSFPAGYGVVYGVGLGISRAW
jgi:hypothetical protein